MPDVAISLSSRIAPEIREYPRASTTVANAYVVPIVRRYLAAIEAGLRERGASAGLWLMKSNGGIATAEAAAERPVEVIESGPAAGLAAAGHYAALVGSTDLVSLDMGGTTAKVGMIERGETRQIQGWELGASTGSGAGVAHASGLPILGLGGGPRRDRRGRREHCVDRRGRHPARRAAERRRRPRSRLLRPGRDGADRDGRERRAGEDRRGPSRRWPPAARRRGGRGRDRAPGGATRGLDP